MAINIFGERVPDSLFRDGAVGGGEQPESGLETDGSDLGEIHVNGASLCRFPVGVAKAAVRTMTEQGPVVEFVGPNEAAAALSTGSMLLFTVAPYHNDI